VQALKCSRALKIKDEAKVPQTVAESQEAQARFARTCLCLPYNEGRKETLKPK
jgi:hypothetical protein